MFIVHNKSSNGKAIGIKLLLRKIRLKFTAKSYAWGLTHGRFPIVLFDFKHNFQNIVLFILFR